jgi:hypothetical protein
MGYLTINNKPVFITRTKNKVLSDFFENKNKDKDAIWILGSKIAGNEACKERQAVKYDYLVREEIKDSDAFFNNWIYFDLIGEEAMENTWEILYDYCNYWGHSVLVDLRDTSTRVSDSYSHRDFLYPMGKVFLIVHNVQPHRWWWSITQNMEDRQIKMTIDVNKVTRIKGTLDNFELYIGDLKLVCNKDLEITFI